MPESPIRKLVPYSNGAKASGKKVYHLNIGQPDIETPEVALRAVQNFHAQVIEYSPSAGFTSYREGLAEFYKKNEIHLEPEEIMVTCGGSEAISFALNSICDAGDEIIIPEPFYANYNGFTTAAGVNVVPVTSDIDNGFALPPIASFEKQITNHTKAIIICNPGNPTGKLYTIEELEALRDLVLKHDLYLIADEVYREFIYEGTHHSILNLDGLEQNAIVIDSVSKRYSMCGVRIGALISRNSDLMETALKFAQARLSPPTFGQVAGEAALNTPQSYFDEVKAKYVRRRDVLVDGLNTIPGVKCPKPQGAFYCVAELPIDDADVFAQWILESFDYNGQTVMVAPGSGFYATEGLGKSEVRIAYVLQVEDLKNAVEVLRRALDAYPGNTLK